MPTDTCRMEISALFFGLMLSLILCELNSSLSLNVPGNNLKQRAGLIQDRTGAWVSTEALSVKCKLKGTARLPAFSIDGDYVIGGVFSIHHYKQTVKHNYTVMPEPLRCTGRLVRGRSGGERGYYTVWRCFDLYDVLTIML